MSNHYRHNLPRHGINLHSRSDHRRVYDITNGAKLPLNDSKAIKTLAYELEREMNNALIVFGAEVNGKPQLMVTISENLTKDKNLHAGNMIRELAKEIQGGGGGQPFFATAGGKDAGGLDSAIEKAKEMI